MRIVRKSHKSQKQYHDVLNAIAWGYIHLNAPDGNYWYKRGEWSDEDWAYRLTPKAKNSKLPQVQLVKAYDYHGVLQDPATVTPDGYQVANIQRVVTVEMIQSRVVAVSDGISDQDGEKIDKLHTKYKTCIRDINRQVLISKFVKQVLIFKSVGVAGVADAKVPDFKEEAICLVEHFTSVHISYIEKIRQKLKHLQQVTEAHAILKERKALVPYGACLTV